MDQPETRFTVTRDRARCAYQVFGDGPHDLLIEGGPQFSPVDLIWEEPLARRMLERLASFARVMVVDFRGTGASDDATPTNEVLFEDQIAVLDAVGAERAVSVGIAEGGTSALAMAAAHPERTARLVLINTWARLMRGDDYPWGYPARLEEHLIRSAEERWGTGAAADWSPSTVENADFRHRVARRERMSIARNTVPVFFRGTLSRDCRAILTEIQVPTLILHRAEDPRIRVGHGRYLAEHIPNAKYVELPGADHHVYAGDQDAIIDEIQEFVTGSRPIGEAERVFATVLFTDVVNSTQRLTELGDRRWREILDEHDRLVARELERHNGRKVNPTGDGILATFDGPARAVRCAQAILEATRTLGIELRAGLHAGEVEVRGNDIGGIAVHIGQRVSALAGPGEVLVSRTVTDLVAGSGIAFEEHGEYDLKGVPGRWAVYSVRPTSI